MNLIAEFCQNHNGDFAVLKEMICQAAESGATHGKIQTIFANDLTHRERFEQGKIVNGKVEIMKRPYPQEYERLKKLELTYEEQARFIEECHRYGLRAMTTCFARGNVAKIAELPWDVIKVASYDCGSVPLLRDLASHFQQLVISTGASYDHEIAGASATLSAKKIPFVFLHCVTIYPTPLAQMNLRRMNYLKKFSTHVGLSDHSLVERDGVKADVAAIFLGAETIERHFTILEKDKTKDGPVSIRPAHLKEICTFSKLNKEDQKRYLRDHVPEFELMLGNESRELTHEELVNRDYYRGRFATHTRKGVAYNWEENSIE